MERSLLEPSSRAMNGLDFDCHLFSATIASREYVVSYRIIFVLLALFTIGFSVPQSPTASASMTVSQAAKPTLRRGSSGAEVRELQRRLNVWIAAAPQVRLRPLPITGTFGPATETAVKAFQRARSLAVDGIVGPRTWAALPADPAGTTAPGRSSPPPATPPSRSDPFASFYNPVPRGSWARFPGLGSLMVHSSWQPGQTGYAIVLITFVCERPAHQICDTGDFMLDVVGGSGQGYRRDFNRAIPEPSFGSFMNPDLYGGGTEAGYAGFLVTRSETTLKMIVKLFLEDGIYYFQI
jgi:peptidoglycan hydrolase-like protein with peptidoglycan-binding domain